MRTLVTGAGGFVGRELVPMLLSAGHEVVATDRNLNSIGGARGLVRIETDLSALDQAGAVLDKDIGAIIHLATVPGGAAEHDPVTARRVNVEASMRLFERAETLGTRPRFVFASSIAVFGHPLPPAGVDDATPLRPHLLYGMHKAMIETALATYTRRGAVDGVSLRLPGILSRPPAPSGMKSAFMSELFHSLVAGESITLPVSRGATLWLMSVTRCAWNLAHAVTLDTDDLPPDRAMTLPALHVSMEQLARAVAAATGADFGLVEYEPDRELEAAFGSQPPLATTAADRAGMRHDGDLETLVKAALAAMGGDCAEDTVDGFD